MTCRVSPGRRNDGVGGVGGGERLGGVDGTEGG